MSKVYQRQSRARKDLETVWKNPKQVNIIHYSCESFLNRPNDRSSPRVSSIAVRNLKKGQTELFSIYKIGMLKKLAPSQLQSHHDELEKEMLASFFEFAEKHKRYKWLHWNMRDENYGFHALEMRYKILNKKSCPYIINDDKKFDLAKILIEIYDHDYIAHPRLKNLMEKNKISNLGFKSGEEEASLFDEGKYVELDQSTQKKVSILSCICRLAYTGTLETESKCWDESDLESAFEYEDNLETNAKLRNVNDHSMKAFMSLFNKRRIITFFIAIFTSLIASLIASLILNIF